MKVFNKNVKLVVEKIEKPVTAEQANIAVDGVCPDDTEPKPAKKGIRKRAMLAIGGVAAFGAAGLTVLAKKAGSGPDSEDVDAAEAAAETGSVTDNDFTET